MLFQEDMMIKYDAPLDFRCTMMYPIFGQTMTDPQCWLHLKLSRIETAWRLSDFSCKATWRTSWSEEAQRGHGDLEDQGNTFEKGLRGHVSRSSPSASADRHAFEAVRLRQRPPRITVTAKSRTKEVHRQKMANIFRQSKNWCPAEPQKNWLCYVEVVVTVVTSSLTCPPLLRRPERPTAERGLGKGVHSWRKQWNRHRCQQEMDGK